MMEITVKELNLKLFKWRKDLPFKIDTNVIVVDDINQFIEALDAQFAEWETFESEKLGKIE